MQASIRFIGRPLLLTATMLVAHGDAAAQSDLPVTAAVPEGGGPVARVVQGIISYTHWPVELAAVQLCIVGNTRYQDQIASGVQTVSGKAVRVRNVAALPTAVRGCNVLYLGPVAGLFTYQLAPQSMLTISEHDVTCRGGSMFCLHVRPERVSFSLNLDAVARSGLRVDPKVLILGRAPGSQP